MEKTRILVVDDDEKGLKLLEDYFLEQGYEVILARDGQAALDKIRDCNPQLIIMDIVLPRINGWEACQRIKKDPQYKYIPVVMSSSLFEAYDKPKECEADVYVNKPVNLDHLLSTVKKLLIE